MLAYLNYYVQRVGLSNHKPKPDSTQTQKQVLPFQHSVSSVSSNIKWLNEFLIVAMK